MECHPHKLSSPKWALRLCIEWALSGHQLLGSAICAMTNWPHSRESFPTPIWYKVCPLFWGSAMWDFTPVDSVPISSRSVLAKALWTETTKYKPKISKSINRHTQRQQRPIVSSPSPNFSWFYIKMSFPPCDFQLPGGEDKYHPRITYTLNLYVFLCCDRTFADAKNRWSFILAFRSSGS